LSKGLHIEVKVFRYNPDADERFYFDSHSIPYTRGMTVLDLLTYIYENYDSTLAYRWNCRSGQCGACALLVNGRPTLACHTLVEKGHALTIAPLPQFQVKKDLLVDFTPAVKRLLRLRPYVERSKVPIRPETIKPQDVEAIKEVRTCVECWACVSACPVVSEAYQEFAGPAALRHAARLEFDPRDVEDRVKLAFLEGLYDCTTCRRCVEVCPKEIDIPHKAIEKLRIYAVEEGLGPLPGHLEFLDKIRTTGKSVDKRGVSLLEQVPEVIEVQNPVDEVVFFTGCLIDYSLPKVGLSILEVLRRNRVRVHIPRGQVCCGSPALRVGVTQLGEELVQKNVSALERLKLERVVVGCPGCGMTLRRDYAEVMRRLRGEAPRFKVYEMTDYLVKILGLEKLSEGLGRMKLTATYHDACNLNRDLGLREEPRRLIDAIPGLKFVEMEEADRCCGAGGGVRSGRSTLAAAMGRRKAELLVNSGAEACVVECPFCYVHLEEALQRATPNIKMYYLMDLLADAYSKTR